MKVFNIKAFSTFEVFLLGIIIGGISIGLLFFGTGKNNNTTTTSLNLPVSPTLIPQWKKIVSSCGFTFQIPDEWKDEFFDVGGRSQIGICNTVVDKIWQESEYGLDSHPGSLVRISAIEIGTYLPGVLPGSGSKKRIINSLNDYYLHTGGLEEYGTDSSVKKISIGSYDGILYKRFGFASGTSFIFQKNRTIYEINWLLEVSTTLRNQIIDSQIKPMIESIQFS